MSSPSQCLCEGPEKYVPISSDNGGYRKRLFSLNLDGDPKSFNPDLSLNSQARAIKYNPKLEIDRSNFVVGKMLGSGNFGCVFEGILLSLYFKIIVKTIENLFCSNFIMIYVLRLQEKRVD